MNNQRKKAEVLISFGLRIIMIALFIIAIWQSDFNWVFGAGVALLLTFVPMILERNYHITLPWILEFLIVFALFLGFAHFRSPDSKRRMEEIVHRYPGGIESRNAPFPLAMILVIAGTVIWAFFYILVYGLLEVAI